MPGPAVEDVLERGEGLDVEVVGGLVEDEDVRLGQQQARQLEPAPLTTAEVTDARLLTPAREAETGRELAGADLLVTQRRPLLDVLDGLDDAPLLEALELADLLGEVGDGDGLADLAPAAVEGDLARQGAQQRRLAGAVDPDDADALPRRQPPRHVVEQAALVRRLPDRHRGVLEVEHVLAEAAARERRELDAVAGVRLVGDEGVGGVDAELRLARARRRTAAQPGELLAHEVGTAVGHRPRRDGRARPSRGRTRHTLPRRR